jgi:hypothetical protein
VDDTPVELVQEAIPEAHPTGLLTKRQYAILTVLRAGAIDYVALDLEHARAIAASRRGRQGAKSSARARPFSADAARIHSHNTFGGLVARFPDEHTSEIGVPLEPASSWEVVCARRSSAAQMGWPSVVAARAPSILSGAATALVAKDITFTALVNAHGRSGGQRGTFALSPRFGDPSAAGGEGAASRIGSAGDQLADRSIGGSGDGRFSRALVYTFSRACVRGMPNEYGSAPHQEQAGPAPGSYTPNDLSGYRSSKRYVIGKRYAYSGGGKVETPGPTTATWDTIPKSSAPSARVEGRWSTPANW